MIFRIVPIVPVVSKNFETIGTTETIAGFHMIVWIASNTEDTRLSAMFQSKLLNSAEKGTASRPEPDGTYFFFFFSQVSPIRGSDILIFFFCFSRVQPEFLSYCFPDIHPYKLILIVLRKFVVNCRIFLHFFHKERRV